MAIEQPRISNRENPSISGLLNEISADRFQDWYRERQHRQNIENGTPYFNGPDHVPDPERHSPSSLLQCHRKVFYRQCNAPAEQPDPDGIFWFGSRFEEDIVFPFLERAVTDPNTYVRNTMWIDTSIETDAGEVRIKGATDPVIVDEDSVPILPIEVKTKSSLDHVDSPNRHHRAQVHAYLVGLSEKYDVDLRDAVILYGGRKSMDLKVFHIEFDDAFWEDVVLEWAREHTQYRLDDELPPATPEYDWECEFCDYRERCGKGETETNGFGPEGFLPLYDEYPRESVVEYLEANQGAKLTPTLAHVHPDLAESHGSQEWHCPACGTTKAVGLIDWDGDVDQAPACKECGSNGILATLSGPMPDDPTLSGGGRDV
ncbi:CRISPR-associated protein Cas4 [Halorhabdus amylolytica]|uniref:CRISPR-associated protein Cas4 n=1 Tax=Halorhabdus amylolytica TaxID=2559573 RepID=UPI0010AB1ED8|nr:PD-(D/E)XK nuclease family protein [Halorhabdus amylolytica]